MVELKALSEKSSGHGEVRGFKSAQLLRLDRAYCYEERIRNVISQYEVFRRKINHQ